MKYSKVTISDIADALGISSVSVSRALSGQMGVSEELRNTILEKASALGYLKAKKSDEICILVLHTKPFIHDNSNFSYMVQGIESAIQKTAADYTIEFVNKESHENLVLPHKLAKGIHFDGVIFIGRFDSEYMDFIKCEVRNQVHYTGYSPAYDIDSVWFNFNNSGYKQCEYLISKGHKKIGFVATASNFRNKEKLLGIATALSNHGLPVIQDFLLDLEDNYTEKLQGLVLGKDRPTAMICQLDFTALELIKLLHINNISVPYDISIIGSGNTEMSALSIPALTTMDLNIQYSCEAAVSLLQKRIKYPGKPFESIAVNSTLIERDSVKSI